jgi:hypothetical protein
MAQHWLGMLRKAESRKSGQVEAAQGSAQTKAEK